MVTDRPRSAAGGSLSAGHMYRPRTEERRRGSAVARERSFAVMHRDEGETRDEPTDKRATAGAQRREWRRPYRHAKAAKRAATGLVLMASSRRADGRGGRPSLSFRARAVRDSGANFGIEFESATNLSAAGGRRDGRAWADPLHFPQPHSPILKTGRGGGRHRDWTWGLVAASASGAEATEQAGGVHTLKRTCLRARREHREASPSTGALRRA
ncbi:hypothetical protein K505DRAFT_422618 [Melanomma pulvis-pyrius CBS 109.77]|uniref:Uncharacterized protein n=1 Tax=Melanomma pulvis-pyrius CBS 109.77 TaxID=1314802 RepID=A0A6A6WQA2_9PLEO|nr:hypothetical protein K505DRAFT_422618 [Melanomma pulvis-pyrius CBS 109.77]